MAPLGGQASTRAWSARGNARSASTVRRSFGSHPSTKRWSRSPSSAREFAALLLMGDCGLRTGEVIALEWDHIRWQPKPQIVVQRSYTATSPDL